MPGKPFSTLILALSCYLAGVHYRWFFILLGRVFAVSFLDGAGALARLPEAARLWQQQFGWGGLILLATGIGLGCVSLAFGIAGWPVSRLWLYYLVATGLALVGLQLIVAWVQIQVLETLLVTRYLRNALRPETLHRSSSDGRTLIPETEQCSNRPGTTSLFDISQRSPSAGARS